jgi:hypothetical protein
MDTFRDRDVVPTDANLEFDSRLFWDADVDVGMTFPEECRPNTDEQPGGCGRRATSPQ